LELILLPLIFSVLAFVIPAAYTRLFGLVATGLTLLVSLFHLLGFHATHPEQLDLGLKIGTFQLDGLSILMLLLTNAIVFLILLANYARSISGEKLFTAMTLLMQFGLVGVFTTNDLIGFYIFWELTLIPIFFILYWYGNFDNKRSLMQFFLYTLFGSLAMLVSVVAIFLLTKESNWEALVSADLSSIGSASIWLMGGFLLAFAVKIPLFPFHTWQAETYTKAPVAGTMLLSALMLKMALFGMLKWMIPLFDGMALDFWRWPVVVLGCIGIVYGALIALKQNDLKTLFAYASLSHLGLIAAALMIGSTFIYSSVMLQVVNHSIVALGLFLAAGIIEQRLGHRNLDQLGGIAKVAPRFGFWFAVLTFVGLSVPFTAGFIGEFVLIKSLFDVHNLTGVIAASTLVLGAVYMLRAYQNSMFGPSTVTSFQDLHWNELLVFAILGIAAIYFGLSPKCILDFVSPTFDHMQQLMNSSANAAL
jgi:NADH-quinone oxidoreductase subunit M